MLSCKHNLTSQQVLSVCVPAGSPMCSKELLLWCCWRGEAGAGSCWSCPPQTWLLCPLSSTSHCAVVFWGYFPPGAWSHEGREEAFLKTSSCSSAVLEAAGSGLCDAPLGGAVERTGEGFSLTLFSCLLCSLTLSHLPLDGKSETAQTSSDFEYEASVVPAQQGIWRKVSGHILDRESKSNMYPPIHLLLSPFICSLNGAGSCPCPGSLA